MSKRFTGIIPPMLTPLTAQETLDRPSLKRLVDFEIEGGVDGLFILGTNGEGAFLTTPVRQELAEATVEFAAGRVPVIAGLLEASTSRVIEGMRALAGRGLEGYVATTPFYFGGFNNTELLEHFRRIAGEADLPVLAYSIPQNTKVVMNAELMMRLPEVPNLVGIKDSSGDWTEFQLALAALKGSDFTVLQGMQSLLTVSLLAGADGGVPGHANVYPQLFTRLVAAVRAGDIEGAFETQAQLDRLARLRGRAFIHTYKLLGKALGLMEDHVAAPLPRLSAEEGERFLAAAVAAGMPIPARA